MKFDKALTLELSQLLEIHVLINSDFNGLLSHGMIPVFANPARLISGRLGDVKPWAIAALVVVVVTIAILAVSPSRVFHGCEDVGGSDCGSIPPLLVGLVGVVTSLVLLFVGALRSIR
jgi:hypothetical protein